MRISAFESNGTTIAERFPSQARRLRLLLLSAAICLIVGLTTPIITLEKFLLVENTFSVLSGILQLLEEGQIFLFFVITAFSVILPILKLMMLFKLVDPKATNRTALRRYLHLMHDYGKWSMLDVFVVAVLVVAVKLGAIASVEMRYGLYGFAAAVLITMYVTSRIVSLTDALEEKVGPR